MSEQPRFDNAKTAHVRFFAPVNGQSITNLINAIEQKLREGFDRFILLISSPGGEVFAGITAYNFLKGIPAEVITFNFGNADSIAAVIYCAGSKRFCVPQGRFLLHGVMANLQGGALDEKFLKERVKNLESDRITISKIIAQTSGRPLEEVEQDILQGTVLGVQEAIDYGLVHESREQFFESGATVIGVQ
jgi:ATP-dependent Clp endopeptidase proteolytic subunit ClpP